MVRLCLWKAIGTVGSRGELLEAMCKGWPARSGFVYVLGHAMVQLSLVLGSFRSELLFRSCLLHGGRLKHKKIANARDQHFSP